MFWYKRYKWKEITGFKNENMVVPESGKLK